MLYVRILVGIACFAGAGWIVYTFTKAYLTASGSRWHRLFIATEGSATILWARFSIVVGLLVSALVNIADYMNLPGIGDTLHNFMTPTTVSLAFAGAAVITELARRSNL